MLRDADFEPIHLRAFGTYALKANDPAAILKELVGTDSPFDTEEVAELMRSVITSALADLLGGIKNIYPRFSSQLPRAFR